MRTADARSPLLRRWYILLVGLLVSGALGLTAWMVTPPKYTARGLVMLLPSVEAVGPKGNPLIEMGGLDLPARLLVAYFSSEPAQTALQEFDDVAEVDVTMEDSTRGPVIAVDVAHETSDGALKALHFVVDAIGPNLAQIQSTTSTPEDAIIRSMPLVLDNLAERDFSVAIRIVVLACALGICATLMAVYVLDGLLLRRREGKLGGESDEVDSEYALASFSPQEVVVPRRVAVSEDQRDRPSGDDDSPEQGAHWAPRQASSAGRT